MGSMDAHRTSLTRLGCTGALILVLLGGTTACGALGGPSADDAARELATGVQRGDITALVGSGPQKELLNITRGMDGLHPTVEVTQTRTDGSTTTVTLHYVWTFASGTWSYDSTATLSKVEGKWTPVWKPSIVHPKVSGTTRLVHQQTWPKRADITDPDGEPLMTYRPVNRIGINKPDADPKQWATSAAALAQRLQIGPKAYQAKVMSAGKTAFVEALVTRAASPQLPDEVSGIPGATSIPDEMVLAPTKTFATGILGSVAPATAEQVATSKGTISPGAMVGQTGLQARYDKQLRGTPGDVVLLRGRASGLPDVKLHGIDPKPGTTLRTTLSQSSQQLAEQILADQKSPAAMVVINPTNGHVVAAATGSKNATAPDATVGRYAPGSTFKAVTALALLRTGMTPDSEVECQTHTSVDGRQFKNYNDFPSNRVGRMTLREAIALSCNTGLITEHARIDGAKLRDAAASLGLGQDMDAGLPAFFGSVPDPKNTVGLAESMIGQGLVEASPMAMATVAASIQAGHTVRPVLLPDHKTSSPAAPPLTPTEADQLRSMLQAVITDGPAGFLSGQADGAKTGTAEYGTAVPPRTHAWMIGYDRQFAVSVMVYDGTSGSGTAGPLIKAFFQ